MALTRLFHSMIHGGSSVPYGVVLDFAGSASPEKWLLCYGQAVSRTTYAKLFEAIGTSWGAGNGTTTFNIPDFRGRIGAGKDDMGGSAAGRLNIVPLNGTRASTSNGVISALSSTSGLYVGMPVTGTGIGTNAVIKSIDSGTQVTLSVNNTATGTDAITFGVINGASLGAVGGDQRHQSHTGTTNTAGAHMHSFKHIQAPDSGYGYGLADGPNNSTYDDGGSAGAHSHTLTTDGAGFSQNVQPTAIVNKIIYAGV